MKTSKKSRIVQGKVGTRSGVPALKKRTERAIRHLSKQSLDELADDTNDRAEAKLSDKTYRIQHPTPVVETRVLATKPKRKKRAPQAIAAAKKRAAEALQKEVDRTAREKAARKAKRRAAARALQRARAS